MINIQAFLNEGHSQATDEDQRPIFSIISLIFENSGIVLYQLASLELQKEQRWEAIYGFDKDLPQIRAEFEDYYPSNPRFRLIENSKHDTIGDLFNNCLAAARGKYIIILHAEDSLDDTYDLADLAKEVESHPDQDYCYFIERSKAAGLEEDEVGDETPHNQLPHRTCEIDKHFYPETTLYYLYKRSTIQEHNLRFRSTNNPHLHEEFSKNYAQYVPTFTCKHNKLSSSIEPFTYPPAMEE